jgi:hypothetical protein
MPVERALPTRLARAYANVGLTTVADIATREPSSLKNIGLATLRELPKALEEIGRDPLHEHATWRSLMRQRLGTLDERRRAIVVARAAPDRKTYRAMGVDLHLGNNRVRGLEIDALTRMRRGNNWVDATAERLARAVGGKRLSLERLGGRDGFFRVAREHTSEFTYFVNEMLAGDLRVRPHGNGLAVMRHVPSARKPPADHANRETTEWHRPFVPGYCEHCTTRTADAIVRELERDYGFGRGPRDASGMLRDTATWVLLAAHRAMNAHDLEGAVRATSHFSPARWRSVLAALPFVRLNGDRVGLVPRDVPGGWSASARVMNAILRRTDGANTMPLDDAVDVVKKLGGFYDRWNVATLRSVLRHDGRCVIVGKQIRRVRPR